MPYTRNPTWVDGPAGLTPITAEKLNNIENGIAEGTQGARLYPRTASNRHQTPGLVRISSSDSVLVVAAGTTVYTGPYVMPESRTIDLFSFRPSAGTGNLRWALVKVDPVTLQPTELVHDGGELVIASTTQININVSVVLTPGVYMIAWRSSASITLTGSWCQSQYYPHAGVEGGYIAIAGFQVTEAYAAWASPPTAWTTERTISAHGSNSGLTIPMMWRFTT